MSALFYRSCPKKQTARRSGERVAAKTRISLACRGSRSRCPKRQTCAVFSALFAWVTVVASLT